MAKKQIMHLWDSSEAVRSVLRQSKVTAACGEVKVLTREGFVEEPNSKTCPACITACNGDYEEYTILSPRGWTALLEKVWLNEHPIGGRVVYNFSFNTNANSWNWPPAA